MRIFAGVLWRGESNEYDSFQYFRSLFLQKLYRLVSPTLLCSINCLRLIDYSNWMQHRAVLLAIVRGYIVYLGEVVRTSKLLGTVSALKSLDDVHIFGCACECISVRVCLYLASSSAQRCFCLVVETMVQIESNIECILYQTTVAPRA